MGPQQKDDKTETETAPTEPKEEEKKQDSPEKKPALPGMLRGTLILPPLFYMYMRNQVQRCTSL